MRGCYRLLAPDFVLFPEGWTWDTPDDDDEEEAAAAAAEEAAKAAEAAAATEAARAAEAAAATEAARAAEAPVLEQAPFEEVQVEKAPIERSRKRIDFKRIRRSAPVAETSDQPISANKVCMKGSRVTLEKKEIQSDVCKNFFKGGFSPLKLKGSDLLYSHEVRIDLRPIQEVLNQHPRGKATVFVVDKERSIDTMFVVERTKKSEAYIAFASVKSSSTMPICQQIQNFVKNNACTERVFPWEDLKLKHLQINLLPGKCSVSLRLSSKGVKRTFGKSETSDGLNPDQKEKLATGGATERNERDEKHSTQRDESSRENSFVNEPLENEIDILIGFREETAKQSLDFDVHCH